MDQFKYDFGYDWPWTLAHLIPIVVFGALMLIAMRRRWPKWSLALLSIPVVWGAIGFAIVHFALCFSCVPRLPTEAFLPSNSGLVLDAGAGSGRSTLMLLSARPKAEVIALDIFSGAFGISDNTQERLLRNVERAGFAERVQVMAADMRNIPLESNVLDAANSSFAIDHLSEEGVHQALAELHRTLKPGGQFLMSTINADAYVRTAFPIAASHGYFGRGDARAEWTQLLTSEGFEIVEIGTAPGTLYLLARSKE